MMDIHCHSIFDVDDGPSTIEESIKMIAEAEKLGIRTIIATPHYQKDLYENEKTLENYNELVYRTSDYNVKIKLGNEVFINPELPDQIEKNEILTLNGSRYLLLELPCNEVQKTAYDVLFDLQLKGIVPVIAHPERNRNFIHSINTLMDLVGRGCLVQLDAASIMGVYGRSIKDFAKKAVKLKLAHFIASNAHCPEDYINWYKEAYRKVRKWAGEEYTERLFSTNPDYAIMDVKEDFWGSLDFEVGKLFLPDDY